MSLQRRSLGRGRLIGAVAAVAVIIGCVLPWFRAGAPESGIPAIEQNAFAGPGILTFLAAVATLALVALPFAAGDRPVRIDRWWSYAALAAVAAAGLVLRLVGDQAEVGTLEAFLPDRAPGAWLAAAGTVGLAIAAAELQAAPPG